jgi:Cu(I)/Ag(I) efflux system membrane fusion protein
MLAVLAIATVAVLGVIGCISSEHDHSSHAHKYTCSMHPDVAQDTAGKCPKCGMDLTEKH